jgi:hypothetical protein
VPDVYVATTRVSKGEGRVELVCKARLEGRWEVEFFPDPEPDDDQWFEDVPAQEA